MRLGHRSKSALVVVLAVVFVASCASSSRRRRRRGAPPPVAAAPPPPTSGQGGALWFGAGDQPTTGRARKKKKVEKGRRVLPASRRRGRPGGQSPIATNLAAPALDSRDWAFLNAFKFAGPWKSRNRKGKPDSDLIHLDPNGWVQALDYGQQAVAEVPTLYGGRMVILYDGRGILSVDDVKVLGEGDGRILVQAKPYSRMKVVVEATNPSDNVRNIRIVPENLESSADREPFHPLFVRRLTKYSVLRFADWGKVATTAIARWEDRTKATDARQTGDNGVAYEFMIQLANAVGADAWISVPFAADDEYVEALAKLVRDNLDDDLKVYIEYATEVWRPGTPAFAHAQREGRFRNLEQDPALARLYFQSQRSLEIFDLFERAFGEERRVVRVVGSKAGAGAEHERLLGFDRAAERVDLLAIDALVGSEFVTTSNASQIRRQSVKWLVEQLLDRVPKTLEDVRASARVASRYGVGLAAYDGGQDLVAPSALRQDDELGNRLNAANRDRGMAQVYTSLLEGWRRSGGELFVHSSFATPYDATGREGSIEYIDQPRRVTPKHDALLAFAETNSRWWSDAPKNADATAANAPPPPPPPANAIVGGPPPGPPPSGPPPSGPPRTPPPGGAIDQDVEPVSNTGVWTAGTVGAAGVAMGWLFTGLYLTAAGNRDLLLAEQVNLPDGTPARDLDNAAYRHSIGSTLGFTLAFAGAGTALVMTAVSDLPIEDAAQPAMILSGATGIVSAIAGTAFLIAHNSAASERDQLLADNPMPSNSAPIRSLDNEAFRWSLVSLGAYTVSAAGFAVAAWLFFSEPSGPSSDYYLDTYYEGEGFTILPTGVGYRW